VQSIIFPISQDNGHRKTSQMNYSNMTNLGAGTINLNSPS
jgi:hypothetical protein